MHRFARAGVIGLIGGALLLTGCSASGATTAPGTSSSPIAGGSTVGPGESATGQGGTTATCTQLTAAEAQPLIVDQITDVTVTPTVSTTLARSADSTPPTTATRSMSPSTAATPARQEYDGTVQGFANPVALPGVGDTAMWDSNDESNEFAAIKGTVYCSVEVDAENVPGVGHLMDEVNNTIRIGDANYMILAAAAATLCNRIYGSGDTTIDLSGLSTPPSIAP